MKPNDLIYLAGHTGLVGSALMRELTYQGFTNIITRTQDELDLRNQQAVNDFFAQYRPDYVFLVAARVGGIVANMTYPASFAYDNLAIALNIIHAAHLHQAKKLLFFGSSCIYPRLAPQPMKEEYLLSGPLEPTNAPYAMAKLAGITLCTSYRAQYNSHFISCLPTNLYGPGDHFDNENSHVIPALISRIIRAHQEQLPTVTIWGSGRPRREFLYVKDLTQAAIYLMQHYDDVQPINVGTGVDVTIAQIAHLIKDIIGYEGTLIFDPSRPDGSPQKLLDVSRINHLGWHAKMSLSDGLEKTISWYQQRLTTSHQPLLTHITSS